MSGLHADTAGMDLNGRKTVSNAGYLDKEIMSLRHNVEGLESIWSGLSADEFSKSFEAQAGNLSDFQRLLNELGEAISASADILNRAEEENAHRSQSESLFKF